MGMKGIDKYYISKEIEEERALNRQVVIVS